MLEGTSLGFRAFLYLTAAVAGFGFVLPSQGFDALAWLWSLSVIILAVASVGRHGLVKGLIAPTAALGIISLFDFENLAPVFIGVWLVALFISFCWLGVRASLGRSGDATPPKRRTRGDEELVSVTARAQPTHANAAEVLARFGLDNGERE